MNLTTNATEIQLNSVPGKQHPHGGEPEGGGRGQLAAVSAPQRALQLGVGRPFLVVAQLPKGPTIYDVLKFSGFLDPPVRIW